MRRPLRTPLADVHFTPEAGHRATRLACQLCANSRPDQVQHRASLKNLVGTAGQWQRNGDAEHFGGLEIQEQFNFSGLLNRQFRGLLALENAPRIDSSQTV